MTDRWSVVLVEGRDDLYVLLHLLYATGFTEAPREAGRIAVVDPETRAHVQIKAKEGRDEVLGQLRAELLATNIDRLAVILDADADAAALWAGVRARLASSGYEAPSALGAGGAIIPHARKPTAGVWIMPDNASPGALEHFWSGMIKADDALWPRAHEAVDSIPGEHRRFPLEREFKAKVHTWLAWQEEPGSTLPNAVVRKYVSVEAAAPFLQWFRNWLAA